GVAAEEVIQKRSSVQTGRSDSTASTRKRLYVPPGVNTESDLGKSIVVRGETRREDTSSASAQSAPSELEKKAGQLKAQAVEELGKLGYNNAIVPAGKPSVVHRTTTLQSQYKAALAYYKPMSGLTSGFAAKPKGSDSTAAVRFVYGRANGMRESSDFDDQTVKLYLTARSGYDLYRLTGEKSYYDRAVSARDSLMRFLDRYAGDLEKGQTAKAYREELRQLSFQE
ncbi:MAG: hypothetical protein PHR28_08610, partial [candidate division Zixibacteria bacterium]|nr:hypothetical protein [candidate division Zixibacteria bacterium]